MSEPLVRAESIGRVYGSGTSRVVALHDATFTIAEGDTVSLDGPSGSGKSTLLHLIGGLDIPTSGSIDWPALGDRSSLRPRSVAFAFQGPSLLPPLSVTENVALPSILAGADPSIARATALDLLHVFEIETLANKLPEELSGGQLQRAGIARAFSGSPRLILADEPTGQQDASSGGRLVDAVLTLAASESVALVVATHDASVAERFDGRWAIRDGTLRTEVRTCSV